MSILSLHGKQNGATLIIALVFLLMLLMLALASSQVGVQQEQMTGNYRETQEAFQSAEATVREVEQCLRAIYEQGLSPFCDARRLTWMELEGSFEDELDGERLTDCTLQAVTDADWSNVPWNNNSSNAANDYLIVSLTSSESEEGEIRGSVCKPIEEDERATYLIVARAPGPAGVGSARVQSIFYWKS